jgi:hypothetical protein
MQADKTVTAQAFAWQAAAPAESWTIGQLITSAAHHVAQLRVSLYSRWAQHRGNSIHAQFISDSTIESVPARTTRWRLITLLLLAAAATAVVSPMFFLGNASGHDFDFHLASWLDVSSQWHEGIFYPRWAQWANWGFGEPRFVFYPPASWMLGTALGSVLPWRMAPGAFIWLTLIFAGFAMWRLARECLAPPQAAAAAVFFAVNPYHLVVVYYRSDFAELLASALLPLMVLGALRVIRDGWRGLPLLASVFAAIWLSNAPAAVISTYSLALLLAIGAIYCRGFRPLVVGGTAMLAGFGLAAFYIFPAAFEQRWIQIAEVLAQNLRPERNFLFTSGSDPEFVLFNWKVSGVALTVMLIAGIAAVLAARRRREFPELWWMLLALGLASAMLMFPPVLLLWRYLPKLRFVQFPWRWLVPLGAVYAFFIAAAAGRSRRALYWWAALLVITGAMAPVIVRDAWWDSEDIPVLTEAIRSGQGYEGTDEYAPLGCDRYSLPGVDAAQPESVPPATPRVTAHMADSPETVHAFGVRLHVDSWTAERESFTADSARPATIAVRLIDYPAWQLLVDGAPASPRVAPKTAQFLVPLAAGSHHVELIFVRTWDRSVGTTISAVTAMILLTAVFIVRRRDTHQAHGVDE